MTATIRSIGTGSDVFNELDIANTYWIPSIPNFAEIDAAIVVGSTLHAIQYTIEATHKFDTETFWDNFASVILAKLLSQSIEICWGSATYPDVVDHGIRGHKRYRFHCSVDQEIYFECDTNQTFSKRIDDATSSNVRTAARTGMVAHSPAASFAPCKMRDRRYIPC
eukprot:scaffold65659_cov29-Attheya_sp.AAC.2